MTHTANSAALERDYPTGPVHIIEPFGLGGGPDLLARALAPRLSELWGQAVTVGNCPGAGATAGPAQVANAPADGYTLLLNTSAQAYSAAFLKNLPYDPLKDFIPVAPLTSQPYVLVAGKPAGITTVGELIAAAKAKPGELRFGSTGPGTGTHLGVVKFNLSAGLEAVDVPPQPRVPVSGAPARGCPMAAAGSVASEGARVVTKARPAATHPRRPRPRTWLKFCSGVRAVHLAPVSAEQPARKQPFARSRFWPN